jgi:hypothetical protein
MNPIKPNILILITRLFCIPQKQPGIDRTGPDAVGSVFSIDPILKDFVEYVTASSDFPEGSAWNPGQVHYKVSARRHMDFQLPVSLREFQSDLMLHMDTLPTRPSLLAPIRAEDFDARGRRRAVFLCTQQPEGVHVVTSGGKWLRSCGYDTLRDLFLRTKNETVEWLKLVHSLGIPTKALSTAELGALVDVLGDGGWVKGITVSVDTSFWPGQVARI